MKISVLLKIINWEWITKRLKFHASKVSFQFPSSFVKVGNYKHAFLTENMPADLSFRTAINFCRFDHHAVFIRWHPFFGYGVAVGISHRLCVTHHSLFEVNHQGSRFYLDESLAKLRTLIINKRPSGCIRIVPKNHIPASECVKAIVFRFHFAQGLVISTKGST